MRQRIGKASHRIPVVAILFRHTCEVAEVRGVWPDKRTSTGARHCCCVSRVRKFLSALSSTKARDVQQPHRGLKRSIPPHASISPRASKQGSAGVAPRIVLCRCCQKREGRGHLDPYQPATTAAHCLRKSRVFETPIHSSLLAETAVKL